MAGIAAHVQSLQIFLPVCSVYNLPNRTFVTTTYPCLPTFCFTCFLPFQIEMVAQGNDGVVLKVTCARPALTEPSKVYALKGLINYHNAKTMSRVSHLNNA